MIRSLLLLPALALGVPADAVADGTHGPAAAEPDAVSSPAVATIRAPLDILAAHVHRDGRTLVFHMTLAGPAGEVEPQVTGSLGGAPVHAYVWPTTLDPAAVGFETGSGILALAATSHPDFDDTPQFDEDADGNLANDGARWHSHWVVLVQDDACGPGALKVRDIPEGAAPPLPATWPGLAILIDSPGWTPVLVAEEIRVTVPFADADALAGTAYDGVTAALRVHADLHDPLLCVTEVFDVASGDLSLPGRVK